MRINTVSFANFNAQIKQNNNVQYNNLNPLKFDTVSFGNSADLYKDNLDKNKTGWVVILSNASDPEHYEENVDKLRGLTHKNWKYISSNADFYLSHKNSFYIYLENGDPKLCMRVQKREVENIQGTYSEYDRIPIRYLKETRKRIQDMELLYNMSLLPRIQLVNLSEGEFCISHARNELAREGTNFSSCTTKQLLDSLGYHIDYDCKKDKDGLLILKKYAQPPYCMFEDIGIDENKLFKDIKEIKGDADFRYSNLTDLGSLKKIGGNVNIIDSKLKKEDFANIDVKGKIIDSYDYVG